MNVQIDNSLLTLPVKGLNLKGTRFEDQIAPQGMLLVFLRHLGCTFCRETVHQLREAAKNPDFPPVVFVHQGSLDEGIRFFSERWTDVVAIADPELELYHAFKLKRGTMSELFGPQTLISGLKGLMQGHGIGLPVGDPFIMPGMFFIKSDEIVWEHKYHHAGDHPKFDSLGENLAKFR